MPSPVGHALGGAAVGLLIASPASTARARWMQAAVCAAIGVAPDLDLLLGRHRLESHSIGMAAVAGAIAALAGARFAGSRFRTFLTVAAAWFSHALLDYLGADTSHPYGVMIWWPFSSTYYYAGLTVLLPISRRWWLPGTVTHNLHAALREIAALGPLAGIAAWISARRAR